MLLQIYHWVCQWKNFENRLTLGGVMGKSLVSCFFDSECKWLIANHYYKGHPYHRMTQKFQLSIKAAHIQNICTPPQWQQIKQWSLLACLVTCLHILQLYSCTGYINKIVWTCKNNLHPKRSMHSTFKPCYRKHLLCNQIDPQQTTHAPNNSHCQAYLD